MLMTPISSNVLNGGANVNDVDVNPILEGNLLTKLVDLGLELYISKILLGGLHMYCETKTSLIVLGQLDLYGVRVNTELLGDTSARQVLGEGRLDITNQLGVEVVHSLALITKGEYLRGL